MQPQSLIVSNGLTKAYGPTYALRDLSLEIRQGEVYGLLGPNGSGKTTTIRLWLGLMRPTSGRATIFGFDCWQSGLQVRRLVSYLPGELRMPGSLSGLGVLKFLSGLRDGEGLDRAAAIAEKVMKLDLRRKVRKYSTGMKQKLALAQAFADPVDVLILDEPTSALDPSARLDVLNLVREARAQGQTVVFSGHVLSEVEAICDRVAILRRGRLVHVEDMHARRRLRMLLIRFADGRTPSVFPEELGLSIRKTEGPALLLEHRGELGPLLQWLGTVPVEDLAIGTEDLHSLYNEYHGAEAVDEDAA
ncbi:ABC transporter ATP-binding protein [Paludisphaera rhizosphaerae]|uniref:ABC transporter ATP-binding protein n=1 Tax=Paludisphaera rhizosphaerae TaxID=2711216 RepID=UPI0013EA88E7|nr:ABC transporter ATP-binding protein [Paludisphaera rhizosphaerae]